MKLTSALLIAILAGVVLAQPPASQPTTRDDGPRLTIAKDVTFVLGPLGADGRVDFAAALDALAGEGVKPADNAYPLLLRALGPSVVSSDADAAALARIGVKPPPADGAYFVRFSDFAPKSPEARLDTSPLPAGMNAGWRGNIQPELVPHLMERSRDPRLALQFQAHTGRTPWREAEFPLVAAWLKEMAGPLQLVVEASAKPRRYRPITPDKDGGLMGALLPDLSPMMEIGRALRCRAMLRLGQGEHEKAWNDILAIYRLGGLMSQEPILISRIVGLQICGMAVEAAQPLLADSNVPVALTRRMMADAGEARILCPDDRLTQVFVGERLFMLAGLQCMMLGKQTAETAGHGSMDDLLSATGRAALDWDAVARTINPWYDRMAAMAGEPTWPKRLAAAEAFERDVKNLKAKSPPAAVTAMAVLLDRRVMSVRLGQVLVTILAPAIRQAVQAFGRFEQQTNLFETQLALKVYRVEKGEYPKALADLTPGVVAKLSPDIYSEQPPKYERTAEGYRLYSVGENGRDDAGLPGALVGGVTTGPDDFGVTLPARKLPVELPTVRWVVPPARP